MKKGPKFEADVVAWLIGHGFPYAHRIIAGANKDKGDVGGVPGVVLELKNCREWRLADWITEAKAEAANAGVDVWAVVVKRPKFADPSEAYVVTNLATFAALIADDIAAGAA